MEGLNALRMKTKFSSSNGDTQLRSKMTPEAAVDLQISRYREMTGEQRLAIALELHEMSCDLAREGIRRQHPEADAAEVEQFLRKRLELARQP